MAGSTRRLRRNRRLTFQEIRCLLCREPGEDRRDDHFVAVRKFREDVHEEPERDLGHHDRVEHQLDPCCLRGVRPEEAPSLDHGVGSLRRFKLVGDFDLSCRSRSMGQPTFRC